MLAFLPFVSVPTWAWWVVAPLLAVFVLLFVLFPLFIFVAALFERVNMRELRPAGPQKAGAAGGSPTVAEGSAIGYQSLGVFSDGDRGIKEGISTLMLSPDRLVLFDVRHGRLAGRHRLVSCSPACWPSAACTSSPGRSLLLTPLA